MLEEKKIMANLYTSFLETIVGMSSYLAMFNMHLAQFYLSCIDKNSVFLTKVARCTALVNQHYHNAQCILWHVRTY